jgi:hypothetical protein
MAEPPMRSGKVEEPFDSSAWAACGVAFFVSGGERQIPGPRVTAWGHRHAEARRPTRPQHFAPFSPPGDSLPRLLNLALTASRSRRARRCRRG